VIDQSLQLQQQTPTFIVESALKRLRSFLEVIHIAYFIHYSDSTLFKFTFPHPLYT